MTLFSLVAAFLIGGFGLFYARVMLDAPSKAGKVIH